MSIVIIFVNYNNALNHKIISFVFNNVRLVIPMQLVFVTNAPTIICGIITIANSIILIALLQNFIVRILNCRAVIVVKELEILEMNN